MAEVYLDIRLELSWDDIWAFPEQEPKETLIERVALERGLMPDHMYTVMPVQGKEAVKLHQVICRETFLPKSPQANEVCHG